MRPRAPRPAGAVLTLAAIVLVALPAAPVSSPPGSPPYRSHDGTNNNLAHPHWGSTGTKLLRLVSAAYADGRSAPSGPRRPGPREISNSCADQAGPVLNRHGVTDLLWAWGQFLDHDISLTGAALPPERFDIAIPRGDPYFDPRAEGDKVLPFLRSTYAPGRVRQQINEITAWIDASQVYGSSEARARALRRPGRNADRLRTSRGRMLPFNVRGLDNAPDDSPFYFLAGDVRANENVVLSTLHTLFVREHNRIAGLLRRQGGMGKEERYQLARALVAAEMQAITYREFLPHLLGANALAPYQGYRPSVHPGISNLFSTASFRLGHTLLPSKLMRLRANGRAITSGPLRLRDAFFNPEELLRHGLEPLLRGLCRRRAQEVDTLVVDDVRNFLFGRPGHGGFDLVALNLQRGRDHGLPSYNQVREELGLPRARTFEEISSSPETARRLAEIYSTPGQIDVWLGGLAEDPLPGAMVGELIFHVLRDQFERLRDGDRFWYQRSLPASWVEWVEEHTLSRIIRLNTRIGDEMPADPFAMP